MVSARALLAVALVSVSCTKDLAINDTKFHCASDADCIDGWACNLNLKICALIPADDGGIDTPDAGAVSCGFNADFTSGFDASMFAVEGSAAHLFNVLRLTPASNYQTGALWYTARVPALKFSYEVELSIGGGTGADGMAIGWITETSTAIGGGASNLGIAGLHGYYVEVDTHSNSWDPPVEHISLIHTFGMTQPEVDTIATSTAIGEVRNNGHHVLHVDLDRGRAQISFDRMAVLTATIAGYASFDATFGASAATGDMNDAHDVHRLTLVCP